MSIHPNAKIHATAVLAEGATIAAGVKVGPFCTIGAHVKLYHGVTLGAKSFRKDEEGHIVKGGKRHPTVEDDVTIYPNATILGGETVIGKGSTIGGNVTLMHSVTANSLVVYEEAQLQILDKSQRSNPQVLDYVI